MGLSLWILYIATANSVSILYGANAFYSDAIPARASIVSTIPARADLVIYIPYNAPCFDSFTQGRPRRRALAACALSTLALLAVAASLLALRWHLGLD